MKNRQYEFSAFLVAHRAVRYLILMNGDLPLVTFANLASGMHPNPYLTPQSEPSLPELDSSQGERRPISTFSVVFNVCMCFIVLVAVMVQAPQAVLIFGVPPTIPLWINLRQICYWKSIAATTIMNLGALAYMSFFFYVYHLVFFDFLDPILMVALIGVAFIGTPCMAIIWVAAGVADSWSIAKMRSRVL